MFKQMCSLLMVGAMCVPAVAQTTQRSQAGEGARQQQGGSAADQPVTATERDRARAGASARAGQGDAMTQMHLVQDLRLGNQKEIEISELAQEEAQSDQVKQFAQQMVQAHQQINRDLQPGRQAMGQGDDQGDRAGTDVMAMPGGGDQLSQIHEEVCERQIASSKKMLSKKQGTEFDKAYMGMQIHAHQAMLDKLDVYQEHLPQRREVLEQAREHTQQHLEQAQQIMQQLERQG